MNYKEHAREFEPRWRKYWTEKDTFHVPNPGDPDFEPSKDKFVVLDFFPYPSGAGLHVGHPVGYIATDVRARYERMRGRNVLYSMGFDSFGLPAEQYAIQSGQHPGITTGNNVQNILRQLDLLGLSHDPRRRFSSADPDYYRWTQWIFLKLYNSYYDPHCQWTGPDGHINTGRASPISELVRRLQSGDWAVDSSGIPVHRGSTKAVRPVTEAELPQALDRARLAYLAEIPVNWCPMLGTVLANEEVTISGLSERGNYPVFKRPLKQWVLRITAYSARLTEDLAALDWPSGIIQRQRDWIAQLHDWLFSRQRYWGEPFPAVFDVQTDRCYPLAETELPVTLPDLSDFEPRAGQSVDSDPEPPLARVREWVNVRGIVLGDGTVRTIPVVPGCRTTASMDGISYDIRRFRRDVNTMPNWAGSCWYYLRYFDPRNDDRIVGSDAESYWSTRHAADGSVAAGAVDLYVGGAEHAVLHLLYARFWHKFLYDLGYLSTREPFQKLINQGLITADAYRDSRGVYVDVHEVEFRDEGGREIPYRRVTGERLSVDPGKMGKRYKNGIPPEEVTAQHTVDAFRVHEMFMGPLEVTKTWRSDSIIGSERFLAHIWALATEKPVASDSEPAVDAVVADTVRRVTAGIEGLRLNVAISAMMEMVNVLLRQKEVARSHVRTLVLLVSPFAPYLAEELMARLYPAEHRENGSVLRFEWPPVPGCDTSPSTIEIPVQVNGRKRSVISVRRDISDDELRRAALADPAVIRFARGREITQVITIMKPGPVLVNIILR